MSWKGVPDGARVRVAGAVIARQRPGTAELLGYEVPRAPRAARDQPQNPCHLVGVHVQQAGFRIERRTAPLAAAVEADVVFAQDARSQNECKANGYGWACILFCQPAIYRPFLLSNGTLSRRVQA